jgi:hypothetical protein
MRCGIIIKRGYALLCLTVLWASNLISGDACSFDFLARQSDHFTASTLIKLVANNNPDSWNEADSLSDSVARNSPYRWIADHALALIRTRQSRYSDAWRLTELLAKDVAAKSISQRISHAILSLWLAIEAESLPLAETRFKKLLSIATDRDLPNDERMIACEFLGKVVGMLQNSPDSCIPALSLANGCTALESNEPKLLIDLFQKGCSETQHWRGQLLEWAQTFEKLNEKETLDIMVELKNKLKESESELDRILEARKEAGKEKIESETDEKKLNLQKYSLKNEMRVETPGRPSEPRRPHSPGTVYRTEYETDPKTGKREATKVKDDAETRRAEKEYERSKKDYEEDMKEYRFLWSQWKNLDEARRNNLKKQFQNLGEALEEKNETMRDRDRDLKELVSRTRELRDKATLAELSIVIAEVALSHVNANKLKVKSMIRPSNFPLLRFDAEVSRLERNLRLNTRS